MKILVINAGSSSLKYQLIDMTDESVILKGVCERITFTGGQLTQKTFDGRQCIIKQDMPTHKEAMEIVLKAMLDKENGALNSIDEISAVGHRVLHSGEDFHSSVVIDDEVIAICEKNAELGPLHMPGNIACIKSCREVMPGVPMVAVFDTTFHSTMPAKAYMYGIPYSVYEQYKIRKYGFHGTSHKFVSEETIKKYHLFFIYDVREYLKTLEWLSTLNGKLYIASHCEATDNILPIINANADKVNEICNTIYSLCEEEIIFEDILQKVFMKLYYKTNIY